MYQYSFFLLFLSRFSFACLQFFGLKDKIESIGKRFNVLVSTILLCSYVFAKCACVNVSMPKREMGK